MSDTEHLSPQVVKALLDREREVLIGRLLPGVVHNISGAVQMIRLPIDLVEMLLGQNDLATAVQRLEMAHNGLERLGHELDLLASKCRQEGDADPGSLDLAHLARTQLDAWHFDLFYKHEVQLNADLEASGPLARAAWVDVALALNCLTANALEAMQGAEAPSLAVEVWRDGGRVGLKVKDSGPGPSPELRERMFDPFVSDKGDGHSGLGLFLAREALAMHGGEVFWQDGEGGGFVLSLPAA